MYLEDDGYLGAIGNSQFDFSKRTNNMTRRGAEFLIRVLDSRFEM
jgi:hypothetical protein